MSSGTKVGDYWTPVSTPFGPGQIGSYWSKTWAGEDDPNHRAINNYTMYFAESRDGIIKARLYPNSSFVESTWINRFGGVTHAPIIFDSNDDISLVNKLGDKIRRHEFNAAVSLGAEGKEALEQVARAALSVGRGMRDLKRGNVQGALRNFGLSPNHAKKVGLHKTLSQKVLATQLGWLPLLNDVQAGYDAFRVLSGKPLTQTFHASQRKTVVIHPNSYANIACGEYTVSRKLTWTLSESFSTWDSLSLSSPYDVADALWNGAPLSFIADWFIPIGSYLSARSLVHKLSGSGYTSTMSRKHYRGVSLKPYYEVIGFDQFGGRSTLFTRARLSSLDSMTALPTFRDFSKIPSWTRALTATTLATQMFL